MLQRQTGFYSFDAITGESISSVKGYGRCYCVQQPRALNASLRGGRGPQQAARGPRAFL
jgi:hypothetical protein